MTAGTPSRRDRVRMLALQEIRRHGYDQIAAGGPTALSLNGIARAMGMSGPAMYRYFTARDELLVALVTESWEDFADALERAASLAHRRAAEGRLRAVLDAARAWALAQPHRYRLVFGSSYGSGELDPGRIVPASHRSMRVFIDAMGDLRSRGAPLPHVDRVLARQLVAWSASRDGAAIAVDLLGFAVASWTRLHGVISLEIEGTFAQMGLDPDRLYAQATDEIVTTLRGRP